MEQIPSPEQCEQARQETMTEMREALAVHRITPDYLARKLKSELNAKERKFFKLKRSLTADKVLQEMVNSLGIKSNKVKYKIIAETGEEQLVAVDVKSLGIRQRAREDAQKLLDAYPDSKLKVDLPDTLKIRVTLDDGTD